MKDMIYITDRIGAMATTNDIEVVISVANELFERGLVNREQAVELSATYSARIQAKQ